MVYSVQFWETELKNWISIFCFFIVLNLKAAVFCSDLQKATRSKSSCFCKMRKKMWTTHVKWHPRQRWKSNQILDLENCVTLHWYLMVEISANFSYVDFFPSNGFWVSKQALSICLWTCRAGVMRLLPVQMFAEKQKKRQKKDIFYLHLSQKTENLWVVEETRHLRTSRDH